jgi:hypothetical protein
MIFKYFSNLESLVKAVCSDMEGKWVKYGGVHVVRIFSIRYYSNGSYVIDEWDWKVVPYCSKVRDRLLLKNRKPVLAFVRVGYRNDEQATFYIYVGPVLLTKSKVEKIIEEYDEMINQNWYAIEMKHVKKLL